MKSFALLALLGTPSAALVDLYQADFANGTYLIDTPGTYRLAEDISFKPNAVATGLHPADAGRPMQSQFGRYDPAAFGIGFFAAIAVFATGVTIDLNGKTLEQSREHALLQRFYANIELADQPFVPNQGPSNFGDGLIAAHDVTIKNGSIGRSSHHGIHGNENSNVNIENVNFFDYEVAAVALNGVEGLTIKDCIGINRKDVPVLGTFSSIMFIHTYVDWLVSQGSNTTLTVQGTPLNAEDMHTKLRTSIQNVYDDVMATGKINNSTHPEEYKLFHNAPAVVDGNSYGILLNARGVAVNGFPYRPQDDDRPSRDVELKNVRIEEQVAAINEVVPLGNRDGNAVIDPVGAVIQLRNVDPDGNPITLSTLHDNDNLFDGDATYIGSIASNAQLLVGKATLNGEFPTFLDTSRQKVDQAILEWVEADPSSDEAAKLSSLTNAGYNWLCNGDSMFHVNKGVIAFKLDGIVNGEVKNCAADGISNRGAAGSSVCGDYTISHPQQTLAGYNGADTRGFSIAGSNDIELKNVDVVDIHSDNGDAYGIDVFTDSSEIDIKNVNMNGGLAIGLASMSYGIHFGAETNETELKNCCVKNFDKDIESDSTGTVTTGREKCSGN